MNFEIPLKEHRIRPHQVAALHWLVALNWMGAGAMAHRLDSAAPWGMIGGVLGAALLVFTLVRNRWVRNPRINGILRILEILIQFAFAVYAGLQGWWPALIAMLILWMALLYAYRNEQKGRHPGSILISEKGVQLPGKWGLRFLGWEEVENLILRHGVFTLNCRDGRLYQYDAATPLPSLPELEVQSEAWIAEAAKSLPPEPPSW